MKSNWVLHGALVVMLGRDHANGPLRWRQTAQGTEQEEEKGHKEKEKIKKKA